LQVEWDLKKARTEGSKMFEKSSMKGATPGCPQQSNSSDCGIYVLHYIENFFKVGSVQVILTVIEYILTL